MAAGDGIEARGAVFTKPEVVNFILDLSGYKATSDLSQLRILEPSFGGGDFLIPAIKRLLGSWRIHKSRNPTRMELQDSIVAFELHKKTFEDTRDAIRELLTQEGITEKDAGPLVNKWLQNDDYLLAPIEGRFDFVVGNPPYVRQELIPAPLLREYRSRFSTLYDRADIYIPFIERSLGLLGPSGVLGFICADRWMKNKYGGPLRKLVSGDYHLKIYVDMSDTQAFQSDVIAYPAITIIERGTPGPTHIARHPVITQEALEALAVELTTGNHGTKERVRFASGITNDSDPWLLSGSSQIELIRRLEEKFPTLEEAGCKVGIGVATGADRAFIADYEKLDVEDDRKLPLVRTRDIASGEVGWLGKGIINPFKDDGGLVDLSEYPRLNRYLEARRPIISGRHCAQKNPRNWYRTIDRITPSLLRKPKLLVPDIKGQSHIVYEDGRFYPHHNLYYIVSEEWDLRSLQAVLLSSLSRAFISVYSTKMRGGFLRFQAQYLRRIRIPEWSSLSESMKMALADAAVSRDIAACDEAVCTLFGLTLDDLDSLEKAATR
ncbi:Eco57I restriction-modification methylase domain-containing protein [Synechococcus sp. CCY 0621]|uniref:Eco57I restriction-modification methylase domain-containing protein n=1 Tax=Synechococcus sp. CCY 0621 TaxID=2815603 RepID=UPI00256FD7F0|nr:Eco57I restriction-modification methylase domain-containing protein [Synechococcus sp. CCY 0621]